MGSVLEHRRVSGHRGRTREKSRELRALSQRPVIVTSSGGQVLSRVSLARAARLLALGLADPVAGATVLTVIRSPSLRVPVADVIEMRAATGAHRPWNGRTAHSRATPGAILRRDGHRCAYCGVSGAATVDHILPASRGGETSFANLVACCGPCNTKKADRTPEEAGMELRWAPHDPVYDPWAPDQARVHALFALSDAEGSVND